jgi:hypothetical protein
MKLFKTLLAAAALALVGTAQSGPIITNNVNAAQLADAIKGTGITITNATLSYAGAATLPAPTGTFTGGTSTVGFNSGVVLTNGTTACATGANTQTGCGLGRSSTGVGGVFDRTTLAFDFTSTTGQVFFQYVFGSDEYNEYVNAGVNDQFELLLNGVNIARIPMSGSVVSIDTVNCTINAAFFRNNASGCTQPSLNLDIQYDGLTTILTASGTVATGTNNFSFTIFDRGDSILDSGVFIREGSFSGNNPNPVPAPGSLALAGLALVGLAAVRRRHAA